MVFALIDLSRAIYHLIAHLPTVILHLDTFLCPLFAPFVHRMRAALDSI